MLSRVYDRSHAYSFSLLPSPFSQSHLLNMASLTAVTHSTAAAAYEVHRRRPRFLCLHGFRTSGEIMRAQMMRKWPNSLTSRLDLVFADGSFPAEGKSEVEGIFDPPYYEWFQFNELFTKLRNFEVCVAYIEELMMKHGPFDGLMGFSQGAILSAALPGLQAKGFGLTRVPRLKNVVIISGIKLQSPIWAEVYDAKINCPSLHFIGDRDVFKPRNEALLDAFVDATIVRHRSNHTIPRLDKKNLEAVLGYVEKIEKILDTELSNCSRPPIELSSNLSIKCCQESHLSTPSMGSLAAETHPAAATAFGARRRPRFLCLHGFRTSGEIMRKQVMSKWSNSLTSRLDLFFADAPFPAEGKSEVEGIFDPPYYEWFQFNKEFTEYRNLDECLAYIEELMMKHGPFDGLMGFSQGAILSSALPGLQAKGLGLTRVPPVKNLVIISGGKFKSPVLAEKAYDAKIKCPSLHFIGDLDFLRTYSEALLDAFVDTTVVRHPNGHTVPRLDEKNLETVLGFVERIEKNLEETELSDCVEAAEV